MPLAPSQRRHLRSLAQRLKPIVRVGGNGDSDALVAELERALDRHELVKLRFTSGERAERERLAATLLARTGAELVQRIGKVACLYRRNPAQPGIPLPR